MSIMIIIKRQTWIMDVEDLCTGGNLRLKYNTALIFLRIMEFRTSTMHDIEEEQTYS